MRAIASQKLPQGSGASIEGPARHQDVSRGPLGLSPEENPTDLILTGFRCSGNI